ncbi:MAG: glycosyltransferase [Nanoarchaeota archaeon]
MKIAIILSSSAIVDRLFYNSQEIGLAKALIKFGISVDICVFSKKTGNRINTIILSQSGKSRVRLIEYDGLRLPGKQVFSLVLLCYFLKRGKDYSVFQVHDSTLIMTVFTACIAKYIKVPCLLYQGMYRDFDAWWKKIIQRIYEFLFMWILFSSLSYVIGKTKLAVEYLKSKRMPALLPSRVIPVGLDTSVFSQESCLVGNRITNTVYDILYIGKLEKRRRPDFLAELLLKLCSLRKDLKVCIIGDGSERRSFLKKNNDLIISGQLTYFPKVENKDLAGIYQCSKVLLNPTTYEIFGMVMLEAMYFGVPVIASAEAGPCEIIDNGKDGILLEGFDMSLWVNSIKKLLNNEQWRREIGERAHIKIRDQFIWEINAYQFKEIYVLLADKKRYLSYSENSSIVSIRLEDVICNLCGSSKRTYLFTAKENLFDIGGTFTLWKCNECGLVYLSPRPAKKEMAIYYPPDKYSSYQEYSELNKFRAYIKNIIRTSLPGYNRGQKTLRKILGKVFCTPFLPLIDIIIPFKEKGKVLDIGCGNGEMIGWLNKYGWTTYGVEISAKACMHASARGIHTFCGDINEACFPSEFFDVITINHVLEHTYDPVKLIKECHRILKKNGTLIIDVPNFGCYDSQIFKQYWFVLAVPTHLYHFTSNTLTKMLNVTNFTISSRKFKLPIPFFDKKSFGIYLHEHKKYNLYALRLIWQATVKKIIRYVFTVKGKGQKFSVNLTIYAKKIT